MSENHKDRCPPGEGRDPLGVMTTFEQVVIDRLARIETQQLQRAEIGLRLYNDVEGLKTTKNRAYGMAILGVFLGGWSFLKTHFGL